MFVGRLLLGDFPPLFDQFQERLAAVAQAMALLVLVKKGDRLVGEPDQDFLLARGRDAAPVGADLLGYGRLIPHERQPRCDFTCNQTYD